MAELMVGLCAFLVVCFFAVRQIFKGVVKQAMDEYKTKTKTIIEKFHVDSVRLKKYSLEAGVSTVSLFITMSLLVKHGYMERDGNSYKQIKALPLELSV